MSDPKQLKAVLTSLREAIASVEKEEEHSANTVIKSFALVLTSELLSRGIAIDLPPEGNNNNNFASNPEWIISLLEYIRTNAGKVAIDDVDSAHNSVYPIPMLAALNGAQGMAASACAAICDSGKIYNNGDEYVDNFELLPMKKNDGVVKSYREAMKRCQDVDDGRLYTLLKLVTTLECPEHSSSSTISKSKIRRLKLQQISQLQHTLNHVAYANYLHGAVNYAVDQPPMWKRCLDSALLLSSNNNSDCESSYSGSELNYKAYFNSQTIQPLNNMIRIAESKGNEKRVKELSLLLAVGYLGGVRERLAETKKTKTGANDGSGGGDGEEEERLNTFSVDLLVQKFFVERTLLPVELEIMTVPSLLDSAKQALSICEPIEYTSAERESWLLCRYIREQMDYLTEESKIWSEVHRQYRSMLNRKPETDVPSVGAKHSKAMVATKIKAIASTKEDMEQQIRAKVYAEAFDKWKTDSLELDSLSSLALRDAVVSLSSAPAPQSMASIVQDCQCSLVHHIERLEAMAIITQKMSKTPATDCLSMWQALLSFVSPMMGMDEETNDLASSVTLRRLLETCSEAVIVASWMIEPLIEDSTDGKTDLMKIISMLLLSAQRILTACKTGRAEEKRLCDEQNNEPSVLSMKERQSDSEKQSLLRLECALETSRCRAALDSALDSDAVETNDLIIVARRATIAFGSGFKAISDSTSPLLTAAWSKALFGTPYLIFLSAWSGLYLSPWPFCNAIGQARTILKQAREALTMAAKFWGRRLSILEHVLLDIGEADLENFLLGGNADVSGQLYHQALVKLQEKGEGKGIKDGFIIGNLKAQCLVGLAKQCLMTGGSEAETHARSALDLLSSLGPTHQLGHAYINALCSYAWSAPALNQLSHSYQLCFSRQLVAEACIQSSRFDDARSFLTAAVNEMPGNFDATFSLASFHLLMQCLRNDSDENEARISLLRAAKMNSSKASPFALLGIWYESKNDTIRAVGCYQKALALEASHPVAGRGLRRLLELKDLVPYCKKAVEQSSPVNGWAWKALGQHKAVEGDDSTSVICFQQALRCRDIQNPKNDLLGAFYNGTDIMTAEVHTEASATWVELAISYRRMGKYSAALRAFEEADLAGTLPPTALCSWAQVDLDVGLFAEAAEKCDRVLAASPSAELSRMAAYIEGESMLSIARMDIQRGKNGSCHSHLEKAITLLEASTSAQESNYCQVKLLGDLYSLGEALPPYVFGSMASFGDDQQADNGLAIEVENKIAFIRKGEEAYAKALEVVANIDDEEEDKTLLLAATATDLGSNILSQAKVIAMALGDGSGGDSKTAVPDLAIASDRVKDLISRSINAFAQAIDHRANDAAAWCGIGSALIFVDPLLSQHAFCRALQIDKSTASLSNISLLYADYDKTNKSAEILDSLTQLEDTPLMWIGRGLLLEKTARAWHDSPASREGCLTRASDAYRASLQIMQHPAALLGLSLTCRRADADVQASNDQVYSFLADHSSKIESRISMSLHQTCTGGGNVGASIIDGLFQIEEGLENLESTEVFRIVKEGMDGIERARSGSSLSKISRDINTASTKCEINLPPAASLQKRDTGKFPNDSIMNSLKQASSDFARSGNEDEFSGLIGDSRNAVILNPDSGKSWLLLAKELAQAASATNDDASTSETISSAKVAAHKALALLLDQLLNACLITPRRKAVYHENLIEYSEKSVVSAIPPSSLVSDAMSIVSWLRSIEEDQSRLDYASLQESLLLDPQNEVAAAALGLK